MDGLLLVDKPLGWTSHDVVAKLRGITGIRKIGHGGTLDPLATGLLVVGIGKATKQLDQYVQGDKAYRATVRFGTTSTTDDAEGELTERPVIEPPSEEQARTVLAGFAGEQEQLPPVYSALKKDGKKAYQLARAGKEVHVRTPRSVIIHQIELISYDWPNLEFECVVSKGTYIRAIARDLGEQLGTGGYLIALSRTKVGEFTVDQATALDELATNWQSKLVSI